jgi:hypothetical protein
MPLSRPPLLLPETPIATALHGTAIQMPNVTEIEFSQDRVPFEQGKRCNYDEDYCRFTFQKTGGLIFLVHAIPNMI